MLSRLPAVTLFQRAFATSALRWKGSSKWSNIKDKKAKNDLEKSKMITQYLTRLRHLVNSHDMGDLDLNQGKVAGLLRDYMKDTKHKKDTFVRNFELAKARKLEREAERSSQKGPSETS